jgi:hypothetical protein
VLKVGQLELDNQERPLLCVVLCAASSFRHCNSHCDLSPCGTSDARQQSTKNPRHPDHREPIP